MKFTDIQDPKALVGLYVLHVSGTSFGGTTQTIKSITGVIRKTFTVNNCNDFFWVDNGTSTKKYTKMDTGNINYCELLTEDEVIALRKKWREARELRELREAMLAAVKEMTLAQLQKVAEISNQPA